MKERNVSLLYVIDEDIVESGPIEPDTPFDEIRKEPLPLPKDFEWCEIDMQNDSEVKRIFWVPEHSVEHN